MALTLARARRLNWSVAAATALATVLALLSVATPAKAHHGGSHVLVLYSMTCWTNNDPEGDDEPYVKVNDARIWSNPDCAPVQTLDLGGLRYEFWNEADVKIMEDDFGPDDTVLYVRVGPQAGQGIQRAFSTRWISRQGYILRYELYYEVL